MDCGVSWSRPKGVFGGAVQASNPLLLEAHLDECNTPFKVKPQLSHFT